MKQTIILGNIITVDEKRPFANEGGTGQYRSHPRRRRRSI